MLYDTIIIGAGPAGCAAAIYATRKKIKTMLITESFGGQLSASSVIENWLGEKSISGFEFARKIEEHVRSQKDLEILVNKKVSLIEKACNNFIIKLESGEEFESKTVIVTAGGNHRKLNIPGEKEFNGKGVAYCSTCDAPMFKNKKVAVIGTGNAGLEAVIDLLNYASKIYMIDISSEIQGDKILEQKIFQSGKVEFFSEVKILEIYGDKFVQGIKYINKNPLTSSGQAQSNLEVQGVFVEIGSVPNIDFLNNLVGKDKFNYIKTNKNQITNQPGIFAAGDITDRIYKQNNIAAGDGAVAALSAFDYLKKL